jgi:MoxR-like ATPase
METMATPKCWQDFQDVIDAGIKRVILHGNPGTGKTYTALTYGVSDAGSKRLICSEEMTSADIEGTWKPSANEWNYVEGVAVESWRTGARLVVDEGDKASGDIIGKLLNFLDSVGSSSWTNPETKEIVTPHANFSAVITSNIEVPDHLPSALRDRFSVAININAPHPNALLALPDNLRVVANAVISAEPERRVSLRAFYDYATLLNVMDMERAGELVFGAVRAEAIIDAIKMGTL